MPSSLFTLQDILLYDTVPASRPGSVLLQVLEQLPGVKGVLVTAGGQGCSYAFKGAGGKMDYTGLVPVLQVKVEDTTGAGDAFLGGFVASLVKVRPPPHSRHDRHHAPAVQPPPVLPRAC